MPRDAEAPDQGEGGGSRMVALRTNAELQQALAGERVVVYKHSPDCWFSRRARREMEAFASDQGDVVVYELDVVAHAQLAREIERILGIRHESPQAIALVAGAPVWSASHRGVRAANVVEAFGEASKEP